MDPVEIRRLWFRLRLDESGITINKKDPVSWDRVGAIGIDHTLLAGGLLVPLGPHLSAMRLMWLAPPVLHVCVKGDPYPRPARAVKFARRKWIGNEAGDAGELRSLFGEWASFVPVMAPSADLNAWWASRSEAHPKQSAPPKEPTSHERVVASRHELEELQHQLDQINRRKKHGLPPT